RNGQEKTVKVKLGRLIETDANENTVEESEDKKSGTVSKSMTLQFMGMTLSELTADLRQHYSITDKLRGLVVTSVAQNSAADKKRI
ncbi:MAG: serine protease, partial [Bartonella sp.]|nr:serine protease [Bartonella sp.]